MFRFFKVGKVGYVSSASVLIRHDVVKKAGYLDERLSYNVL